MASGLTKTGVRRALAEQGKREFFERELEVQKSALGDAELAWEATTSEFGLVYDRRGRKDPTPVECGGPEPAAAAALGDSSPPGGAAGFTKQLAAEKSATMRRAYEWVFNHVDVADVKPGDAPSSGAWSMLLSVRENPDLRKSLYTQIASKLLPPKSEIESTERFQDTGKNVLDLIARVRKAALEEEERQSARVEAA